MVFDLLRCARPKRLHRAIVVASFVLTLCLAGSGADRNKPAAELRPPDLLLEGGRSLTFERVIHTQRDVHKPGFWGKMADIVAGEPEFKNMGRPYSVAVDSTGRILVTDPGARGVHIFDVAHNKYKFLDRQDKYSEPMREPQCVAVDAKDNIYVTDSKAGKIFVFDAQGKFRHVFGSLKGGEGFFKRPTGIAIDPDTQDIFVTDTLRDRVFVLDPKGQVVRSIGKHGSEIGQFNLPTEVLIRNGIVAVVDAMNFRIQLLDRNGSVLGVIGSLGDSAGGVFRPKGIAIDSEGHIYVVEGLWGIVQVFDREGRLLYYFGKRGTRLGEFQLPSGLFIDRSDRVYVADSYNQRVQVFQYHGLKSANPESQKP